ncbi:MAG: hypothetical protein VCF25_09940, partial [Candidatus Poribacteria bacterium]
FYHDCGFGVKRRGCWHSMAREKLADTNLIYIRLHSCMAGCNARLCSLGTRSFALENYPTYCMHRRGEG